MLGTSSTLDVGTIRKAELLKFENQGFLHIPQLMTPEMTRRVKAAYQRAQDDQLAPRMVSDPRPHYDMSMLLDTDPVFSELAVLPELLPYLVAAVGDDVQLIQAEARLFPPGKTFTAPWHSDLANVLGIDLGHSPHFHAKVHFYFEDLQPNQGCLAFLPGTHRLPREMDRPRPQDIDPEKDSVIIVPKAGDAVLFNTHCLHMCLDNTSPADRRTLIYVYSHFWVKQCPNAQPTDSFRIPDNPLARQIFGLGIEGVDIFDQRPWSQPKASALDSLRRRLGKKILGRNN
jgi:ectoine hydroxylase-related dioxygenase (phytanoyl-CoA dioxygenase family)